MSAGGKGDGRDRQEEAGGSPIGPGPWMMTHGVFSRASFGRNHPLSIMRHSAMMDLAAAMGWLEGGRLIECPLASRDDLLRFHEPDYLAAFEAAATTLRVSATVRERYNLGTMECPVFDGLWQRARASVGGAIKAAELTLGSAGLGGGIVFHPGGGTHHGMRNRASGFCYLNDPVFSILTFLDAGLERVLYVDLDAHHGDGVEAAFRDEPRVFTISVHEEGRWPGTGRLEDRAGGFARNLPVPRDLNDSEFGALILDAVLPLSARFDPQAIVMTCGADALKGDPLSAMQLSNVAHWRAIEAIIALGPRTVIGGGGGYNPWTVARGWAGLWARLSGQDIPDALPRAAQGLLEALDCDLVDDDERDPAWIASIADRPNCGSIRPRIHDIIRAVLA